MNQMKATQTLSQEFATSSFYYKYISISKNDILFQIILLYSFNYKYIDIFKNIKIKLKNKII